MNITIQNIKYIFMDIKIQNKNSFLSSHILYDLMYTKKKALVTFLRN